MESKQDNKKLARRTFLAHSGVVATGIGVGAVGLNAALDAEAGDDSVVQSWPWPYQELDVELVRKRGHQNYYKGGCMYGASGGLLSVLREEIGQPYTGFPHDMMRYGGGGIAGWGTVCGSLNGACAMLTLIAGKSYGKLVNELMAWYTVTPFPSENANQYAAEHEYLVAEYKTDAVLPTTVSNSPLCHVSVNTWCRATGYASGSRQRAERCARLTGDVAAKAAELLNLQIRGEFVVSDIEESECSGCHVMGENYEAGQFIIGKGSNCTNCHGDEPHSDNKESGSP